MSQVTNCGCFFSEQSGPFYIPGTRVDVHIPFTGEERIFRSRTNPFFTDCPRGEVTRGLLRLSISLAHDVEEARFTEIYERELQLVKKYVELSHQQVVGYSQSLPSAVQQAVTSRRKRLSKHAGIAAMLDIPLAAKVGAPPIAPGTAARIIVVGQPVPLVSLKTVILGPRQQKLEVDVPRRPDRRVLTP